MRSEMDIAEDLRTIPSGQVQLPAILAVPSGATGFVIFAHGSGSGRHSPRNNAVARTLQQGHLATLLVDLLTEREATNRANAFDIPLLANRLIDCRQYASAEERTASLPVGIFGASTGAGAALLAAAELGPEIRAVVSRGGRPDLAGDALRHVTAPTLLIAGGNDSPVIALNEQARSLLPGTSELVIVPDATHLFEEPGTLEEVSRLASNWFQRYLPVRR